MLTPQQADDEDRARPPEALPPLGSWPRLYAFVVVWQVCLVLALLYFQRTYS